MARAERQISPYSVAAASLVVAFLVAAPVVLLVDRSPSSLQLVAAAAWAVISVWIALDSVRFTLWLFAASHKPPQNFETSIALLAIVNILAVLVVLNSAAHFGSLLH